jgi:hypothetical protein
MPSGDPWDIYWRRNNDGRDSMTADILTILMVLSLGIFFGTAAGLIIGFCAKKQKPDWQAMSIAEKHTNIALVGICSVICTAAFAWYAYRPL